MKNRFDDYNEFEATMDRRDREMERMFGSEVFDASTAPMVQSGAQEQPGMAAVWEDIPNNPAGIVIKGIFC